MDDATLQQMHLEDADKFLDKSWTSLPESLLVERLPRHLKSLDLHQGQLDPPDSKEMAALRQATLRRLLEYLVELCDPFQNLELVRLDGEVIYAAHASEAGKWPLPLDIQRHRGDVRWRSEKGQGGEEKWCQL